MEVRKMEDFNNWKPEVVDRQDQCFMIVKL
jgi:hypothetical protein